MIRRQNIVALLGVLLCLAAAIWAWRNYAAKSRQPLSEREIAMRVLGEYLQKNAKPRSVLLISNPFTQTSGHPPEIYEFQKASERGLRAGLGPDIEIKVVFPKLKPEALTDAHSIYVDPTTTTPLSYLVADGSFDELAKANPDTDTLVSVIGLPVNIQLSPIWQRPGPPRCVLLLPDLRMAGDTAQIQQAFKSGKIVAAVVPKPGPPPQNWTPNEDFREKFAERFTLLTQSNMSAITSRLNGVSH